MCVCVCVCMYVCMYNIYIIIHLFVGDASELARFTDCSNLLSCLVIANASYEAQSCKELSLCPGK